MAKSGNFYPTIPKNRELNMNGPPPLPFEKAFLKTDGKMRKPIEKAFPLCYNETYCDCKSAETAKEMEQMKLGIVTD